MVAQYFDVIVPQQNGYPRVEQVGAPVMPDALADTDFNPSFGSGFDSLGALVQQLNGGIGGAQQFQADQDLSVYGNSAGADNDEAIAELESPRSVVIGAGQDTLYPNSSATPAGTAKEIDGKVLPVGRFSQIEPFSGLTEPTVTTIQPTASDSATNTSWLSDGGYSLMGSPAIYLVVISPRLYDSLLPVGYSLDGYGYGQSFNSSPQYLYSASQSLMSGPYSTGMGGILPGFYGNAPGSGLQLGCGLLSAASPWAGYGYSQALSHSGQYLYPAPQPFIPGPYGIGAARLQPDLATAVLTDGFQPLTPSDQGALMPQQPTLAYYAAPGSGVNPQLANYATQSVAGELLQQAIAGLASGSSEVPMIIQEPRGELLGGVIAPGNS